MLLATPIHDVGVIIILSCISSFCGILRINDIESRSEVIQGHRFWYQLITHIHVHIPISGQWQRDPILHRFRDTYGGLNVENRQFSLPYSYSG